MSIDLDTLTSEFLNNEDDEEFTGETNVAEDELADANPDFVEEIKETPRAKRYRLKIKKGLNFAMRMTVDKQSTVADAAAIIEYGPQVSKAIGNLADQDEKVRKVIDFITDDGISNPYVTTIIATMPLLFQIVRNHEHQLEKEIKPKIKIPFTKKSIKLPGKFHLSFGFVRHTTASPNVIAEHVFGNPFIREILEKQEIKIAWNPNYARNAYANGTAR